MDRYRKGHKIFLENLQQGAVDQPELMSANPQQADTMVITCCDSRVNPNQLFHAPTGSIFVYRNIAGVVPEYGQDPSIVAAIDFALTQLSISTLIILGHSQCVGVAGMNIQDVLAKTNPSVKRWLGDFTDFPQDDFLREPATEERALLRSLKNCQSYPDVVAKLSNMDLQLHTMHFNLQNAALRIYEQNSKQWQSFV